MKFYRYFNAGEKGIKRFSNNEFTSAEVKESLIMAEQKNEKERYFYLPTYQDRGRDFCPLYYPYKGIKTIEQLEEFLHPKQNTFVWDNDEWKLKIHTPEQLISFYDTYVTDDSDIADYISNIKKCNKKYDSSLLEEINNFVFLNTDAYSVGIFQGMLMAFQMEQIEKTGSILISKNLEYEFLDEPCERFDIEYVSDTMDFPWDVPEEDFYKE